MNPNLKDLRIAVVPTETGNEIDQNSTVEAILACKETQIFSLPDYFKAQNDGEVDFLHWSFLINIKTNDDCTGMNTDGIDMNCKAIKIGKIKAIINEWGGTTACDLELSSSPCLSSKGTNKNNISELVERFNYDGVTVITYHNQTEINEVVFEYEDLNEDIIDEIMLIMEDYEAGQIKLHDSCKNEDF